MGLMTSLAAAAGRALYDDREAAELQQQLYDSLTRDPVTAIHAAPIETARKIYAESFGLVVATTYGSALRRLTDAEDRALKHGSEGLPAWANDPDAHELARRSGLVADSENRQLRFELDRSGLVALTVPAGFYNGYASCQTWEGLSTVAGGAPAIQSADTASITLLFARPAGDVRRRLELDISAGVNGLERIRQSGDQSNVVAVPHLGTLERWLRLPRTAPPALPEELAVLLSQEAAVSDAAVSEWLQDHYRPAKKGEPGLKRTDVYEAILAANGWLPTDFDVHTLSRAFASVFESKRGSSGITWLIARREDAPTIKSIPGVSVERIDPVELAAFRSWRASLEVTPARVRARKEAAAAAAQRAEEAAMIARIWGTRETLEMLKGEGYLAHHQAAEGRRYKSAGAYGEPFVALQLGDVSEFPGCPSKRACPEWWTISPPGTPPAERYRRLVQVVLEGAGR